MFDEGAGFGLVGIHDRLAPLLTVLDERAVRAHTVLAPPSMLLAGIPEPTKSAGVGARGEFTKSSSGEVERSCGA